MVVGVGGLTGLCVGGVWGGEVVGQCGEWDFGGGAAASQEGESDGNQATPVSRQRRNRITQNRYTHPPPPTYKYNIHHHYIPRALACPAGAAYGTATPAAAPAVCCTLLRMPPLAVLEPRIPPFCSMFGGGGVFWILGGA